MENKELVKFFNQKRKMSQFIAQNTIADLELFSDNFLSAIEEAKVIKLIEEEKEQEKLLLLERFHTELAEKGFNLEDLLNSKPKAKTKKTQAKRKAKYEWIEIIDGVESKKTWSGVGKMPLGFSDVITAANKDPQSNDDRQEWLLAE